MHCVSAVHLHTAGWCGARQYKTMQGHARAVHCKRKCKSHMRYMYVRQSSNAKLHKLSHGEAYTVGEVDAASHLEFLELLVPTAPECIGKCDQ